MVDWSHYTVELQPMARKLEEHLNRREYREAEETANRLALLAYKLAIYSNEACSRNFKAN